MLDQSMEFPFEAPTPSHEETHEEEVIATSQETQLDDVIERIRRLNLEENEAPPADQLGPSRKILKWAIKTLGSVHPYEVRKVGTRISTI